MISLFVPGVPVQQGSKRHVGNGIMVEDAAKVKPWREAVIAAARDASGTMEYPAGAVQVELWFYFPRPKSHFGTGRNAALLKDSAPMARSIKPDLDKLVRAALDALTMSGRVWRDDAQVAELRAYKAYDDDCGMRVRVRSAGR